MVGVGHQNVIKVRCDAEGRMLTSSLEEEISFARQEGLEPFCVIATSGTTVRGAFDPLGDIADVAHREGLAASCRRCWVAQACFHPAIEA